MDDRPKCVLLNSGGLDSVTLLGLLFEQGWDIYSLFIDYGQNVLERERDSAEYFASIKAVDHTVITVKYDLLQKWGYISARNTWFLGLALAHAELVGADNMFAAFRPVHPHSGERDQNPAFVKRWNKLARRAVNKDTPDIKLHTPFEKIASMRTLLEMAHEYWGDDISRTISCPMSENSYPCGRCSNCTTRKKLFKELNEENDWHLEMGTVNM